jgi:hypothetical protein
MSENLKKLNSVVKIALLVLFMVIVVNFIMAFDIIIG